MRESVIIDSKVRRVIKWDASHDDVFSLGKRRSRGHRRVVQRIVKCAGLPQVFSGPARIVSVNLGVPITYARQSQRA